MTTRSRLAVGAALRPVAVLVVTAAVGAAGTLAVGAAVGMHPHELEHVGILLLPALAATIAVTAVAARLLRSTPLRGRLVVVSLVAGLLGLANLAALSRTMFVSSHDATTIAVLLCYSLAAGVGAATEAGDADEDEDHQRHGAADRRDRGEIDDVGNEEGTSPAVMNKPAFAPRREPAPKNEGNNPSCASIPVRFDEA